MKKKFHIELERLFIDWIAPLTALAVVIWLIRWFLIRFKGGI